MATLTLNPDRLLPADPTTREIARELYGAVRDLPIISPHGHVPPQWLADDTAFDDPTSLLITPDHYINRMMHAHGVSLVRPGRRPGRVHPRAVPQRVPDPVLALEGLPRARRSSSGSSPSLPTSSTSTSSPARRPPTRSTTRSMQRSRPPPSDPEPCTSASTSSSSRPRTTRATTCGTTRSWPTIRPGRARSRRPSAPTSTSSRPRRRGTAWSTRSARSPGSTPAPMPAGSLPWRTAARSSRPTARSPPTTRTATPEWSRWRTPRPSASTAWPAPGTITVEQGHTLRRNFMFQQARMASEDGLVMTMHPAVYRNHHAADVREVRRRRRRRHPDGGGVRQRPATHAVRVRHSTELPGRAVHHRRDRLLPRARPAGRASTRRSSSGRRGGSSTPPRR